MYLRESRQKRADGSALTHLQLAENRWDPERQRAQVKIIYNCGRAEDGETTERLRRLAHSILRRCGLPSRWARASGCSRISGRRPV